MEALIHLAFLGLQESHHTLKFLQFVYLNLLISYKENSAGLKSLSHRSQRFFTSKLDSCNNYPIFFGTLHFLFLIRGVQSHALHLILLLILNLNLYLPIGGNILQNLLRDQSYPPQVRSFPLE